MNFQFLKQLIISPREIGSLVPSSRFLAKEMVRLAQLYSTENTTFIEVGPGTGAITKFLIESIKSNQRLMVVEKNETFFNALKNTFASTEVIHGCVSDLLPLIKNNQVKENIVIVSSLPWVSFSNQDRENCLLAVHSVLSEFKNAIMLQYTYSKFPPIQINQIFPKKLSTVYLNLPPASIWIYRVEDK